RVGATRGVPSPGAGGAGGFGGALYCQSDLAATNCTFNANRAGDGGNPGTAAPNSDVTSSQDGRPGSDGGHGGGIFNSGRLALHACTVSGNIGGNGSAGGEGAEVKSVAVPGRKMHSYTIYGG